jgi:hypothetical protein
VVRACKDLFESEPRHAGELPPLTMVSAQYMYLYDVLDESFDLLCRKIVPLGAQGKLYISSVKIVFNSYVWNDRSFLILW